MVSIGTQAGLRTEAFITDMNAPLGRAVGNALEFIECVETLKGNGPPDISALVVALAIRILVVSGSYSEADAGAAVADAIASGRALEKMRAVVAWQGGDPLVLDDYSRLPAARKREPLAADHDGYLSTLQADLIGRASMTLGAGRQRIEDRIDPGAGVLIVKKPGERIVAGETILELLHNDHGDAAGASALARDAIRVTTEPPAARPLVLGVVQ